MQVTVKLSGDTLLSLLLENANEEKRLRAWRYMLLKE